MIKRILFYTGIISIFEGCVHAPRCGNPEGAKVILEGKQSCVVRIRQVIIGADLAIPESLKNPELADAEILWVEPSLVDGKIVGGHFVIIPANVKSDAQDNNSKVHR